MYPPTDTKRVTFCDNVTVHNFDNGESKKCRRRPNLFHRQRNLHKKAAAPPRFKTIQVRSFHKRNGQVIGHRRRLYKKPLCETQDILPSIDEASKLLIRSLLIQDKIDMARGKF